jgi:hypothetical protein
MRLVMPPRFAEGHTILRMRECCQYGCFPSLFGLKNTQSSRFSVQVCSCQRASTSGTSGLGGTAAAEDTVLSPPIWLSTMPRTGVSVTLAPGTGLIFPLSEGVGVGMGVPFPLEATPPRFALTYALSRIELWARLSGCAGHEARLSLKKRFSRTTSLMAELFLGRLLLRSRRADSRSVMMVSKS